MGSALAEMTQPDVEGLFRSHRQDVYRLALSLLGNVHEADDVLQTTFLNALRALRRGCRPRQPHAWLLAIAKNACKSRLRERARSALEGLDPDREEARAEADVPNATQIADAFRHLKPSQRRALALREIAGASQTEVAQELGLSFTATQSLLARARSAFLDELAVVETPIDCVEARVLVQDESESRRRPIEERRRLRAHLRACDPCRQHAHSARARSSRLGVLLFPWQELCRVGAMLGRLPGSVGVSGAIATAVVAGGLTLGSPGDAVRPGSFELPSVPKASTTHRLQARNVQAGPTPHELRRETDARRRVRPVAHRRSTATPEFRPRAHSLPPRGSVPATRGAPRPPAIAPAPRDTPAPPTSQTPPAPDRPVTAAPAPPQETAAPPVTDPTVPPVPAPALPSAPDQPLPQVAAPTPIPTPTVPDLPDPPPVPTVDAPEAPSLPTPPG